MAECEIKRGFFTLRSCDNLATGQCLKCRRAFCREHAGGGPAAAGGILCVQCAEHPLAESAPDDDAIYDQSWRLRDSYYHDSHYAPAVLGRHFSPATAAAFAKNHGKTADVDLDQPDRHGDGTTTGDGMPDGLSDS